MDREIRLTEDGSHTIYVPGLDEGYHSIHGAIQESYHVFINQGFNTINKQGIRILELGFGTGLNALLTLKEARQKRKEVYYHSVEKYPLTEDEYSRINFASKLEGVSQNDFTELHYSPWDREIKFGDEFTLHKEKNDFREMEPPGSFDLVFFDAFDPNKQPELWSERIFGEVASLLNPGAILVTYSSKGSVRRSMISTGFEVSKVPGPPGKREMVRAYYP